MKNKAAYLEHQEEIKRRMLIQEFLKFILLILIISSILFVITGFMELTKDENRLITITYSQGKEFIFDSLFLKTSLFLGIVDILTYLLSFYFLCLSKESPDLTSHRIIPLIILSLFGYLAYIVIVLFLSGIDISFSISTFISSLLVGIYEYLIYKMYAEKRTYSNKLFWEIFRFAIVGLVAAVFDFSMCMLFQFYIFKGNEAVYVTIISTMMGFLIGVLINYLMSTYMVYKASKSDLSKSFKGMLIFFILSFIGLMLGVGIQAILYDYLYMNVGISFLTYPVDFVIRTLIVMVYNYISRKLFIYK